MGLIESLFEHAIAAVDDVFVDYLPSKTIRDMHPRLFYPVGIFILGCIFAMFMGILIPGYQNQISQTYLAPSQSADSKLCNSLAVSRSGKFLASREGYWEGDSNFSYSSAIYVIKLENVKISPKMYEEYMDYFQYAVDYLSNTISPHFDLAINLLFWMSYSIPEPGVVSNRFYFNADPTVVFDRQFTIGSLTSLDGDCSSPLNTVFDASKGIISVSIDVSSYQSDASCMRVAHPDTLGFFSSSATTKLNLRFDIHSIITAVSTNIEILQTSDLQRLDTEDDVINLDEISIPMGWYFDPRYPGMRPILCTEMTDTNNYCVLKFGNTYALPIFNHRGASLSMPAFCDCANIPESAKRDPLFDCNVFEFLTGFLFYDSTDANALFAFLQRTPWPSSLVYAFYPMYVGSSFAARNYDVLSSTAIRKDMYEFCDLSAVFGTNNTAITSCRFMVFSSFDNILVSSPYSQDPAESLLYPPRSFDSMRYAVTSFYSPVLTGACQSSFSVPNSSWKRLKDVPFAMLEEPYEVCRNDHLQAISDNLGIASGTVSLIFPLWLLLFSAIVTIFQHFTGKKITKAYSERERSEVLETLAVMMLHERDRREEEKELVESQAIEEEASTNEENKSQHETSTRSLSSVPSQYFRFFSTLTNLNENSRAYSTRFNNNNSRLSKRASKKFGTSVAGPNRMKRRARTKRRFVAVSALADDVLTLMEKQDKSDREAIFFPEEFGVDISSSVSSLRSSFLALGFSSSLKQTPGDIPSSSISNAKSLDQLEGNYSVGSIPVESQNNEVNDEKIKRFSSFSIRSLFPLSSKHKSSTITPVDDNNSIAENMEMVSRAKLSPRAAVLYSQLDAHGPQDLDIDPPSLIRTEADDTNEDTSLWTEVKQKLPTPTNNISISSSKQRIMNDNLSLGMTLLSTDTSYHQFSSQEVEDKWKLVWTEQMRYLDSLELLLFRLFTIGKHYSASDSPSVPTIESHGTGYCVTKDALYPAMAHMLESLQTLKWSHILTRTSSLSSSLQKLILVRLLQVLLLHVAISNRYWEYHHVYSQSAQPIHHGDKWWQVFLTSTIISHSQQEYLQFTAPQRKFLLEISDEICYDIGHRIWSLSELKKFVDSL